jgi:hypothetical protein
MSSQQIVTDPSFLLLTRTKNLNGYIVTVTLLLTRYNGYIIIVTNITWKLLHHSRFWAPKKVFA